MEQLKCQCGAPIQLNEKNYSNLRRFALKCIQFYYPCPCCHQIASGEVPGHADTREDAYQRFTELVKVAGAGFRLRLS